MFRAFLKRFGLWPTVVMLTLASAAVSVLITLALNGWRLDSSGVRIAILVPCIVAPLFSTLQLRLIQQLERIREDLHRLSITDELTQTYNRRHFMHVAERRLAESGQGRGLSILIFDLDDFKLINDRYGHLTGDAVLVQCAQRLRRLAPADAALGRYGGEELLAVWPGLVDGDAGLAKRFATLLEGHYTDGEHRLRVTCSIGVAWARHGDDVGSLLRRADAALYRAKQAGRARVERAD